MWSEDTSGSVEKLMSTTETHSISIRRFGCTIAGAVEDCVVLQIGFQMYAMRFTPHFERIADFFHMRPTTGSELEAMSERAIECSDGRILSGGMNNMDKLADFNLRSVLM